MCGVCASVCGCTGVCESVRGRDVHYCVHGRVRVCAGVGGSAWVCPGVCGCAQVCVDMQGCGMYFQNFFWRIESLHQRTLIRFLYEFFVFSPILTKLGQIAYNNFTYLFPVQYQTWSDCSTSLVKIGLKTNKNHYRPKK